MNRSDFNVDFFVIGAPKCGTTTIASALGMHPEICFSSEKEPDFFSKPRTRIELARYQSLFRPYTSGQIRGEGSTGYTSLPFNIGAAARIRQFNRNAKLIYIVRHPIERIVSLFRYLPPDPARFRDLQEAVRGDPAYIHIGRYYTQLVPYLDNFERKNLLLVDFDDLKTSPQSVYSSMFRFLGVSPVALDGIVHENSSSTRLVRPGYLRTLRQRVDYTKLTRFIPRRIRQRAKARLYIPPGLPTVDQALLDEIVALNETDIRSLEALWERDLSKWRRYEGLEAS